MRRRSVDHLVPNEQRTLRAAWQLQQQGTTEIHGYLLARQLKSRSAASAETQLLGAPVMAYSTVYRCLDRLEDRGLIESFDTDDQASGGPPRRMFRLTTSGANVAARLEHDESGFAIETDPANPSDTTGKPT